MKKRLLQFLIIVFLPVLLFGQSTLDQYLVGYWNGDGNTVDASGNNHNGTVVGNVSYVEGMDGQAFAFNNAGYITVNMGGDLPTGNSPRTVSFWMYTTNDSWVRDANTVFAYGNTSSNQSFALDMDNYPELQFYSWGGGGNDIYFNAQSPREGWVHVALSYDGSKMRIYVNLNLVDERNFSFQTGNTLLYIGTANFSQNQYIFDGYIDEFKIYNSDFSFEEITTIYDEVANPIGQDNEITFDLNGTWRTTGSGFEAGESFSISYTFDLNSVDTYPSDPAHGYYESAINSWTYTSSNQTISGTSGRIRVQSNVDRYRNGSVNQTVYQFVLIPSSGNTELRFDMWNLRSSLDGPIEIFESDALPTTPPGKTLFTDDPYNTVDDPVYGIAGSARCDWDWGSTESQNTPPVALAGPDQTFDCATVAGVEVTLDGSGSSDEDGDVLTYSWSDGVNVISTDASFTSTVEPGEHTFTLTVDDGNGGSSSDEVTVTINADETAPVIESTTQLLTLWPPNHKYETVNLSDFGLSVSDNCADLSTNGLVITKVTSDEVEDANGNGDGKTKDDIVIADDYQSVELRKEREGKGNGRVYTIYVSISDGNGNVGSSSFQVQVPHNKKGTAIDDGAAYEVIGGDANLLIETKTNNDFAALNKSSNSSNNLATSQQSIPTEFELAQNYPNPFNPSTTIQVALPEAGSYSLNVYNILGQQVASLYSGQLEAGYHSFNFEASKLSTGIYIYTFRGNNVNIAKKMSLMK